MTLIKICGNRTPADVLAAAEAGADVVGIVFAESRRRVDIAEAQAMVRALGRPLHEHEMTEGLTISDISDTAFREQWLRGGLQTFEEMERI